MKSSMPEADRHDASNAKRKALMAIATAMRDPILPLKKTKHKNTEAIRFKTSLPIDEVDSFIEFEKEIQTQKVKTFLQKLKPLLY
ncbi:hypothetical protein [Rhodonellum sp.]|uniref:hypothetical protein n=1 Tax=Rhodonellum sp. TaxID=2231180 RepID=UPI00271BC46B|nr:hypothetical protein [Rhodonellum sp.]MDO9552224.1 hypothetical protein [Rhodonellum sp.]